MKSVPSKDKSHTPCVVFCADSIHPECRIMKNKAINTSVATWVKKRNHETVNCKNFNFHVFCFRKKNCKFGFWNKWGIINIHWLSSSVFTIFRLASSLIIFRWHLDLQVCVQLLNWHLHLSQHRKQSQGFSVCWIRRMDI